MQRKTRLTSCLGTFLAVIPVLMNQQVVAQKSAVADEKGMSAYLMTYFKDETHGLYFALSNDGYSFTDVNNGSPIIAGDTIAEQKGIRDPYLYRGPDGQFYMALTDLHIFGKREGIRSKES